MTSAPKKLKASDRWDILSKIVSVIKKHHKVAVPKYQRPILETLLFASLEENATTAEAEASWQRLTSQFFDLNEIRVSAVHEIQAALDPLPEADWKSLRIREVLHYTFEKHFAFDLEPLKRKTLELATKQLEKIKYCTPYMRLSVLQHSLGSHVIPLDDRCRDLLVWLGLATKDVPLDGTAEDLKSVVRKADVNLVCQALRVLATDPTYKAALKLKTSHLEGDGADPTTAVERLVAMYASGGKVKVSKTVKKPTKPAARVKPPARRPTAVAATKKVAKPKPKPKSKTPVRAKAKRK